MFLMFWLFLKCFAALSFVSRLWPSGNCYEGEWKRFPERKAWNGIEEGSCSPWSLLTD